ncbi:hypothetical protein Tco_0885746 [Tanacetum coccineum]
MIPESVENGPLIWPTVKENGVIRTKKYAELSTAKKIQADCDMKAYSNHFFMVNSDIIHFVIITELHKDLWERVQLLMQVDDPIAYLNKAMAFLTVVASLSSSWETRLIVILVLGIKSNATSLGETNAADRARGCNVITVKVKGHMADNALSPKESMECSMASKGSDCQIVHTIIPNNAAFQTEDLDTYDSDCDDLSNAQAVYHGQTFPTMFLMLSQSESKEKEDKYMENEIDLEKKIKKLDNILFKAGQSA